MKLAGKKAFITGGNSGIGLATARLFIKEGAQVAITGRNQETLDAALADLGPNAIGFRGDITDSNPASPSSSRSPKSRQIDIVFANAGIPGSTPVGSTPKSSSNRSSASTSPASSSPCRTRSRSSTTAAPSSSTAPSSARSDNPVTRHTPPPRLESAPLPAPLPPISPPQHPRQRRRPRRHQDPHLGTQQPTLPEESGEIAKKLASQIALGRWAKPTKSPRQSSSSPQTTPPTCKAWSSSSTVALPAHPWRSSQPLLTDRRTRTLHFRVRRVAPLKRQRNLRLIPCLYGGDILAMAIAEDLATIARQEAELLFPSFDYDTAWRLGLSLREFAIARGQSIVIDIRRFGQPHQPLFYTALGGTPDKPAGCSASPTSSRASIAAPTPSASPSSTPTAPSPTATTSLTPTTPPTAAASQSTSPAQASSARSPSPACRNATTTTSSSKPSASPSKKITTPCDSPHPSEHPPRKGAFCSIFFGVGLPVLLGVLTKTGCRTWFFDGEFVVDCW